MVRRSLRHVEGGVRPRPPRPTSGDLRSVGLQASLEKFERTSPAYEGMEGRCRPGRVGSGRVLSDQVPGLVRALSVAGVVQALSTQVWPLVHALQALPMPQWLSSLG